MTWLDNLKRVQSTARDHWFPRIMLHEGVNGRGWPLIDSTGKVDAAVVTSIAKFSHWCVTPADLYDSRRDAIAAVKAENPALKIWAHVLGPRYWTTQTLSGYAGRLNATIGSNVCRRTDGSPWQSPTALYARIDRTEVQDALVAAWGSLLASGLFDGIFVDWVGLNDTWIYAGDPTLDLTPWGGSVTVWDATMRAGKGSALAKLRSQHPDAVIVGNGGARGDYPGGECASGWWRENFPRQNGGTWASNMIDSRGMLTDAAFYHAPAVSVLSVACNPFDPAAAQLGLASSCLADGICVIGPSNFDPTVPYRDWWPLPEGRTPGWLGSPTGAAAWNTSLARWERRFDNGIAWVNPATLTGGLFPA